VSAQVSVIVPTRDRPAALGDCLEALSRQTAADRLEVIVVDDRSTAVGNVVEVVGRHPRARLLHATGSGPAAARNLGAAEAHGSILCFTDDDCVPRSDWAERLAEAIDAGADAVAGSTLSAGGALAAASEIVANAPAGAPPPEGGPLTFAPSNNLAVSKPTFDSLPFDESYPGAAAEDRDWCARLIASGRVLHHAPGAVLVHRQQLTLRTFLKRQVRYGEGAYRFRSSHGGPPRLEPAGFYLALVRRAFRQGGLVGLLVVVAQAATALGFLKGWAGARGSDAVSRGGRPASGGDEP
jgi:glycosyltransferase involved in cell wall biosynthesis